MKGGKASSLGVGVSSLGVGVSSLGSRLSLGLAVLSEGGGVDSEWGGVSGKLSFIPLATTSSAGSSSSSSSGSWTRAGLRGRGAGSALRGPSPREELFSTSLHCMTLVSFPPVDTRWRSSCRKLTLVT